ncbi:MAG: hypothetical protein IJC18_00490, partial [Clostridia bacterium]|nr:hypothetical protein [Clostridia bacterium]
EINFDFFTASGICMIIFATSIVCHLFSYDGEKTDKGFELFYNNLSDRRKFIRLLWLSPAYILLIILIFCVLEITIYYKIAMALFFTGVYAAGVFHAYRTYKKSGK